MKKYLLVVLMALILILPVTGYSDVLPLDNNTNNITSQVVIPYENFTHTVFAEYGTTTHCPYCPPVSSELYSIYQSGDYPFYYISLIADKDKIAMNRLAALKAVAVPVVFFDGGDVNEVGEMEETAYRSVIEESGAREVGRQLDISMNVTWMGNAKINIVIDVKNDGNLFYLGILRSYVTEIVSRWNDQQGNPYHFGFLDFAFNRPILLFPKATRTFSTIWDGNKQNGDQTFEDITEDNIMVMSTVSHWVPHVRQGYNEKNYIAFFVDQTTGAVIN